MRRAFMKPCIIAATTILALGSLSACSGSDGLNSEAKYPTGADRSTTGNQIHTEEASIFGKDGLKIFGGDNDKHDGGSAIGVNSFLWRASLDTVSFMPLSSADPFGGVILTDWYATQEKPDERFKIDVLILSRELRSDGIRVRVFKQQRSGGTWRDKTVSDNTARQLEDAILTRARQLRIAQLGE